MTNYRPTIQYTIKFTNLTKLMHVNASLWAFKIDITQGGSPCGEEIGFTMFYPKKYDGHVLGDGAP